MQLVYMDGLKSEFYREPDDEEEEADLSEDIGGLQRLGINVQQVEA